MNTDLKILLALCIPFTSLVFILVFCRRFNDEMFDLTKQNYCPDTGRSLLFHTDNLAHNRINMFLVVESIFAAATASLWKYGVALRVIALLSLIFTIGMWYSIARIDRALSWLVKAQKRVDDTYKIYRINTEEGTLKDMSSFVFMVLILPFCATFIWALILVLGENMIKGYS